MQLASGVEEEQQRGEGRDGWKNKAFIVASADGADRAELEGVSYVMLLAGLTSLFRAEAHMNCNSESGKVLQVL